MLGPDEAVALRQGCLERTLEHLLRARGEGRRAPRSRRGGSLELNDPVTCELQIYAGRRQGLRRHALVLGEQSEKNVLRPNEWVSQRRACSWASTSTRRARSVNRSNTVSACHADSHARCPSCEDVNRERRWRTNAWATSGLALGCGLVQGHGGANASRQRLLVDLLALWKSMARLMFLSRLD